MQKFESDIEGTPPHDPADVAPAVGANLRRLRIRRGLSLERLSRQSSVSRAMLGQIELGQSAPTINVLWKITRALGVTFSALMSAPGESRTTVLRGAQAKALSSQDGGFVSRALFPYTGPRRVEFYQLSVKAQHREDADAHVPGTTENLLVAQGSLQVDVDGETHLLCAGDAIEFQADVPHCYINLGQEGVVAYLVMTYADVIR